MFLTLEPSPNWQLSGEQQKKASAFPQLTTKRM
jgi:hypothetical protein